MCVCLKYALLKAVSSSSSLLLLKNVHIVEGNQIVQSQSQVAIRGEGYIPARRGGQHSWNACRSYVYKKQHDFQIKFFLSQTQVIDFSDVFATLCNYVYLDTSPLVLSNLLRADTEP